MLTLVKSQYLIVFVVICCVGLLIFCGKFTMITNNNNNVSSSVLFMAQQFQNMTLLNNTGSLSQKQQSQQHLNTNQEEQLSINPEQTTKSTIVQYSHDFAPVPSPRDNSSTHLYQNQPILSRRNYDKINNDTKQINHELREKQTQLSALFILDLERLLEDRESADVVFLLGSEPNETAVYAHRTILRARCRSFQGVTNEQLCRIPNVTVSPTSTTSTNVIHWSEAKPTILQDILHYIYSAKIRTVTENDVFDYLSLASDLDLPELVDFYSNEAKKMLNIENVFVFLDNVFQHEEHINFDYWLEILMQFIAQNAAYCVQTESFLNLSKKVITYLASSDYFALNEATIFHYILLWAQHKSNVLTPIEMWTEENRMLINQQLNGVINHLRIFLIDSQTFSQKVDSTGLLPMEFSLDFYKFAALAKQQIPSPQLSIDKRRQPRLMPYDVNRCLSFLDSKLLFGHSGFESLLNQWSGESSERQWRRLFLASQHDFSVEAFHHYCDGFAPTFVFAASTSGYLSGGYSDIPWSRGDEMGRGRYASSERSFVFNLHSPIYKQPTKFDIKKRMFALTHHPRLGPVFGAGADLSIADRCNINAESYSNLPHSYDGLNASCCSLFGDYYFTIAEYEVFTFVDNS